MFYTVFGIFCEGDTLEQYGDTQSGIYAITAIKQELKERSTRQAEVARLPVPVVLPADGCHAAETVVRLCLKRRPLNPVMYQR